MTKTLDEQKRRRDYAHHYIRRKPWRKRKLGAVRQRTWLPIKDVPLFFYAQRSLWMLFNRKHWVKS